MGTEHGTRQMPGRAKHPNRTDNCLLHRGARDAGWECPRGGSCVILAPCPYSAPPSTSFIHLVWQQTFVEPLLCAQALPEGWEPRSVFPASWRTREVNRWRTARPGRCGAQRKICTQPNGTALSSDTAVRLQRRWELQTLLGAPQLRGW